MTKTCGGAVTGEGCADGLGTTGVGLGLAAAGACAVVLGAHAASRHAAVTKASSRITYEAERRAVGDGDQARAGRADHVIAAARRGAARAGDRGRQSP